MCAQIDDLKLILGRVAEVATLFDDDGILVRFMNNNVEVGITMANFSALPHENAGSERRCNGDTIEERVPAGITLDGSAVGSRFVSAFRASSCCGHCLVAALGVALCCGSGQRHSGRKRRYKPRAADPIQRHGAPFHRHVVWSCRTVLALCLAPRPSGASCRTGGAGRGSHAHTASQSAAPLRCLQHPQQLVTQRPWAERLWNWSSETWAG